MERPDEVLAALELRGRRLRRSILVFSPEGDGAAGLARLDADVVGVEEAGSAVLALLEGAPAHHGASPAD